MEETMHVYNLTELSTLPELFEQPEELYIMLLDYIYTDRYNCIQQYDAIINYCEENNYLVNIKGQLQVLNNTVSPQQFVNAMLLIIVSLISKKHYNTANDFANSLLNDITTNIQDYHLTELIRKKYQINLNVNKIFNKKITNHNFYLNLCSMIGSITQESINKYDSAADILQTLQEKDVSFALSYLRLRFNDIFSYKNQFYSPIFEAAQQKFKDLLTYCSENISPKKAAGNFFNYDKKLISYIVKLYQARIHSLLNQNEMCNQIFMELWSLAPDEESYEESVSIYLDNFVRYALPQQQELTLLTQSPFHLFQSQCRQNIVDQAIQVALDFTTQDGKPGVQAVATYYLGVFMILKKDLRKALEYMKLAKKLNNQVYKYPSEMVILTWLPQMIDFDILCIMLLLNEPELCLCNMKDYFEKLIKKDSILLKLSPDRMQVCMANQVLMSLQIFIHEQVKQQGPLNYDEILNYLTKTVLIEQKFSSPANMIYIEHNDTNIYILAQIYLLAYQVFQKVDKKVAQDAIQQLVQLIDNNTPFLDFVKIEYLQGIIQDGLNNVMQQLKGQKLISSSTEIQKQHANASKIKFTMDDVSSVNDIVDKLEPLARDNQDIAIYNKLLNRNLQMKQFAQSDFSSDDHSSIGIQQLIQIYFKKNLDSLIKDMENNLSENQNSFKTIVLLSLALQQQGRIGQAIQQIEQFIQRQGDKNRVYQCLLYLLLSKLYNKQGKWQQSIDILGVILNDEKVKYNIFVQKSIQFNLALNHLEFGNLEQCLSILEQIDTPFCSLLKFNVILQQFKNQLDIEQIKSLLLQILKKQQINELDENIVKQIIQTNQNSMDQQDQMRFIQCITQNIKHFQRLYSSGTHVIDFCQFFMCTSKDSSEVSKLYDILQPQIDGDQSVFLNVYFAKQQFIHYVINLLIVCMVSCNWVHNVDQDIISSFIMFNVDKITLPNSYIQNYMIYALQINKPDILENVLSFAKEGVKDIFMQQVATDAINLDNNQHVLQTVTVQLSGQQYKMNLMCPEFISVLPKLLEGSALCPLNQIIPFQFSTGIEPGTEGDSLELTRSMLGKKAGSGVITPNCVFLEQFNHFKEIQAQFENLKVSQNNNSTVLSNVGESNNFLLKEQEDDEDKKRRLLRAPSARPCLRINQETLQRGRAEQRPLKQLRKFKRNE